MSTWPFLASMPAAERYDQALALNRRVAGVPAALRPRLSEAWPPENVTLLEDYRTWLRAGGICAYTIAQLYIPTAGYLLGLACKPHEQIDLEADGDRVLDYLRAKKVSTMWLKNSRMALEKFRQFLRFQRGEWTPPPPLPPIGRERYAQDLPVWLAEQLEHYQHLQQGQWRPARLEQQIARFWEGHLRLWRWLLARHPNATLDQIRRQDLFDYVEVQLTAGYATSTVNGDLRTLRGFLLFLQEREWPVPAALLRVPKLKEPDTLPRYLPDDQMRLLRDDIERQVTEARFRAGRRDAVLARAAFYLLWHGGLRLGEVEELRLDHLDLAEKKLLVVRGKGQKDRTVYLTPVAVAALQAYLAVRGEGLTDHVFLYRHKAVRKDLIGARVRAAGQRVGVKVTPHQLRHTCATQLLNAGCRLTSIQRLLGHRRLDTTLRYARVHDRTLAEDYYGAMARIEKTLELAPPDESLNALLTHLAAPDLDTATRLQITTTLRQRLLGVQSAPPPGG